MFNRSLKIVLLLIPLQFCQLYTEELVVVIDNLVKKLDEEKSECSLQNWGNKIENTCECCLLRKAQAVAAGNADACFSSYSRLFKK